MSFFMLLGYLGENFTVLEGSWEQVGIFVDFGTPAGDHPDRENTVKCGSIGSSGALLGTA